MAESWENGYSSWDVNLIINGEVGAGTSLLSYEIDYASVTQW